MERKFLAFSCLVLLISIVYFIYTSYQLHIENKNQQEVTVELEVPAVARVYTSDSSESAKLESTEEEWGAFERDIKDFGEFEETTETTQPEVDTETEVAETEGNDTGISPELEKMFIYYKGYLDQHWEVERAKGPLMRRYVELDERIEELGNLITEKTNRGEEHQELVEERQQLYEDKDEVSAALGPHHERMAELNQKWEEYLWTYHGIDSTIFRETHTETLRSWLANQ